MWNPGDHWPSLYTWNRSDALSMCGCFCFVIIVGGRRNPKAITQITTAPHTGPTWKHLSQAICTSLRFLPIVSHPQATIWVLLADHPNWTHDHVACRRVCSAIWRLHPGTNCELSETAVGSKCQGWFTFWVFLWLVISATVEDRQKLKHTSINKED